MRATYVIGKIIALFLVKASEIGNQFTSIFQNLAIVFCEGIQTFIADIDYRYSHIIRMLNEGLQNTVSDVTGIIDGMSNGVAWSIERSKYESFMAIKRSTDLFTNGAFGIREVFIQIGYAVWVLLIITSRIILWIATGLGHCTITAARNIIEGCIYTVDLFGYMLKSSMNFFISVPIPSIIGCILIYFMYRQRGIISNGLRQFGRLIRQICFHMIDKMVIILSSILSRIEMSFQWVGILFLWIGRLLMWIPSKLFGSKQLPETKEVIDKSNLCIICQDQYRSVLLLPCRHLCLCRDCYTKLKGYGRFCPICRGTFRHNMNVYV